MRPHCFLGGGNSQNWKFYWSWYKWESSTKHLDYAFSALFLVLNCAACVPFCFILKDKSEFTHESFIFVLFSYTLKWGFPVKAQWYRRKWGSAYALFFFLANRELEDNFVLLLYGILGFGYGVFIMPYPLYKEPMRYCVLLLYSILA